MALWVHDGKLLRRVIFLSASVLILSHLCEGYGYKYGYGQSYGESYGSAKSSYGQSFGKTFGQSRGSRLSHQRTSLSSHHQSSSHSRHSSSSHSFRHERRHERHERLPRVYGQRMPNRMLYTDSERVRGKIVSYHNFFRSHVRPKASNMLEMTWHDGAARRAQKWADQCEMLTHDNATDRWTEMYGPCGQNIFVATHKVPWFFALKMWNLERRNFTYGSTRNSLSVVGHYTQMVWAQSHKVGCGFSQCKTARGKTFYNYICNYCPIGNYMNNLGQPYNRGSPCGECPGSCNKTSGLCTNACPFADLWVNCQELMVTHSAWLCHDKSQEGLRRRKHCRATCQCKNKIIPKYFY